MSGTSFRRGWTRVWVSARQTLIFPWRPVGLRRGLQRESTIASLEALTSPAAARVVFPGRKSQSQRKPFRSCLRIPARAVSNSAHEFCFSGSYVLSHGYPAGSHSWPRRTYDASATRAGVICEGGQQTCFIDHSAAPSLLAKGSRVSWTNSYTCELSHR